MKSLLMFIQMLVGILVTIAVLLHVAKGEGLGGIGGQARLFASQKDLESGLNKFTTIIAIIFVGLAALLGFYFS